MASGFIIVRSPYTPYSIYLRGTITHEKDSHRNLKEPAQDIKVHTHIHVLGKRRVAGIVAFCVELGFAACVATQHRKLSLLESNHKDLGLRGLGRV